MSCELVLQRLSDMYEWRIHTELVYDPISQTPGYSKPLRPTRILMGLVAIVGHRWVYVIEENDEGGEHILNLLRHHRYLYPQEGQMSKISKCRIRLEGTCRLLEMIPRREVS